MDGNDVSKVLKLHQSIKSRAQITTNIISQSAVTTPWCNLQIKLNLTRQSPSTRLNALSGFRAQTNYTSHLWLGVAEPPHANHCITSHALRRNCTLTVARACIKHRLPSRRKRFKLAGRRFASKSKSSASRTEIHTHGGNSLYLHYTAVQQMYSEYRCSCKCAPHSHSRNYEEAP